MGKISVLLRGIMLMTIFLYSIVGISQTQQAPKIQNPNAASLDAFGEMPLSLYTGTPNINIPLHTLTYGKIQVPIVLGYHPSSVRPAQQPGWVGLGWNLQSYGSISRTVRNYRDESYYPAQSGGGLNNGDPYYPAPTPWYHAASSGSEVVNVSNWDIPSRLRDYFTIGTTAWPSDRSFVDVQADEFSFNFAGHSGKFYYSGPQNQWQVISSENIKVELNSFLTSNEIFGAIDDYKQFSSSYYLTDQGYQSRLFKGFTLTVADGTKYVFGGSDAVEFSCTYGTTLRDFTADNWLLKKIIDVNGSEVNFEYKRTYPTVNLYFGQTDSYFSVYASAGGLWQCTNGSSFSNGTVNAKKHSGLLQWPMYLSKITCLSESLEFTTSEAQCLRYTNLQLTQIDEQGVNTPPNLFNFSFLGPNPDNTSNVNNLKWEKLDWIIIKNAKQDILKQYNFYYQPTTSTGQRLTLNQVTELSANTVLKNAQYTFTYNAVADLPMYLGDYVDHWGFYNNRTVHQATLTQLISNNTKATDINYVTKGLLTSIKYPTGGSSVFTWEPHDYASVVSLNRNSLEAESGYAGGSRVSRIQNFSAENALLLDKKFYYKKNYVPGASISSLPSSGVLNGKPKYYSAITNRLGYDGSAKYNINLVSLNSLSTYSYNAQGSYIGYDEVVEVNSDGSYIKNFFTNYGPDLNGVSHYDKSPSLIGWVPNEDAYIQMNSLELERGLPIGVYKYNSSGIPVQTKRITYRNDETRFNSFTKRIDFNNSYVCIPGGNGGLILASGRKEYNYVYYPIKTEIIDYDAQGQNPISRAVSSVYNSRNLLSQTEEWDSKGVSQKTTYKYPFDFGSDPTLTAMVNAHILSPVIETSKTGNTIVPLMLTKTNFYSPYVGMFVPLNVQVQKGTSSIETIQQFNQYDTKGNLLESQKTNDVKEVYLWGYSGEYPVAKVIGSDWNTVKSFITQSTLDNTALLYTDAQLRTELQKIRNGLVATKALVTTYTYDPLKGITSETDPNGRVTYYEYDTFGRLSVIKDQNSNIIKTFDYNYKQ